MAAASWLAASLRWKNARAMAMNATVLAVSDAATIFSFFDRPPSISAPSPTSGMAAAAAAAPNPATPKVQPHPLARVARTRALPASAEHCSMIVTSFCPFSLPL
ncbi:MAG: hypothetical protein HS111_08935 [Kofleriaceae bacterium]|nr:hypothetical protein [Kofleriaceae bacterium]